MKDKFYISIIIPIYNTEKFLKKCIESSLNQTLKNIEIILINDGSPDKSEIVCKKYLNKYPNKIKYFSLKNGGCSFARNFGLSQAKGKYIMFLDSDDYLNKEGCKLLYEKMEKENLDLCSFNFQMVNEIGENLEKKKIYLTENLKEFIKENDMFGYAANKIFKKEVIEKYKINFPEKTHLFEDMAFVFKYVVNVKKIGFIDKELYYYTQNKNSVMNTINYNKIKDIFISLDDVKNFLIENKLFLNYKKEYNKIFIKRGVQNAFCILEQNYLKNIDEKILNEYYELIIQKYKKNEIKKLKLITILKTRIFLAKNFKINYLLLKTRLVHFLKYNG